jgi:hypothetical protein
MCLMYQIEEKKKKLVSIYLISTKSFLYPNARAKTIQSNVRVSPVNIL